MTYPTYKHKYHYRKRDPLTEKQIEENLLHMYEQLKRASKIAKKGYLKRSNLAKKYYLKRIKNDK